MEKALLEKISEFSKQLSTTKEELLAEFAVYKNKTEDEISWLTLEVRLLKEYIKKCIDYKNYFENNKLNLTFSLSINISFYYS